MINPTTVAAARRMRIQLDATVDAATRALAEMWGRAWDEIVDDWSAAIDDLIKGDQWPTTAQILRAKRAQQALQVAADALDELAKQAGIRVLSDVSQLSAQAAAWIEILASTQLPPGVSVTFARVDPAAIAAIVQRVTGQVTSLTRPLSAEATQAMRSALIRGVAIGDHPEQAARLMLQRAKQGFDGGLHRARVIARTEMLDAHRAAATAARKANDDTLKGWRWHAELSGRTCPACLSMHGTEYPPDEPGPLGHPSCRCTAVPITKTWRELGFDIDEPEPPPFQSGEDWLREQPVEVQKQILGKKGWEQWQAGNWPSDQWAVRRANPGWRSSWVVAKVPA